MSSIFSSIARTCANNHVSQKAGELLFMLKKTAQPLAVLKHHSVFSEKENRQVFRQFSSVSCAWLDWVWDVVSKVPLASLTCSSPAPVSIWFVLFIGCCLRGCYRDYRFGCGVPCYPWERAHWLCIYGFSDAQLLGDDPASWKWWTHRHMQPLCAHAA